MRFFHLADLHIGKRLNNFSLLEDQAHILRQIIDLAAANQPDAILIAGDIYDKAVPSAEAVALFDQFLTDLAALNKPVMIISGNHDSAERLNFASQIISQQGIYLAGVFDGNLRNIELDDEYGAIVFHLLPFVRPANVRRFFPDQNIESYQDALQTILQEEKLDPQKRHVLLAHQFITTGNTSPERSESEQVSIGSLDNIDASVFADYDYVALGHIHRPQSIGSEHIRYAGSPLKYSFSEALHHKSISMVELKEKGNLSIEQLPLLPLHDLRELKGSLENLLAAGIADHSAHDDYLHITLIDEEDLVDPFASLRHVYPNLMKLDFSAKRYQLAQTDAIAEQLESKTPLQLFEEFYEMQQNMALDAEKRAIVQAIFAELGGDS